MTPDPGLSRRAGGPFRSAAPVRLVHLGLGNFFRAHQAWYTDQAADAAAWGFAAFTGRSSALAQRLAAQDGLYTLITRGARGDDASVVGSLSRAHAGTDTGSWARDLASPQVAVVTLTVTEAAYGRRPDGRLDRDSAALRADVEACRGGDATSASLRTVPGRLVAGLAARRAADAGPIAIVSCDNLPHNGDVARSSVLELAGMVDTELAAWTTDSVAFVTTMVDRITPATAPADAAAATALTGYPDGVPVITEPFSEWVIAGQFPAGRPQWETAGATFVDDIEPFEERKLWLLNGAHSLLAYAGLARGLQTVSECVRDDTCSEWLQAYWDEASPFLSLPPEEVAAYRVALRERFANPRIEHRLAQIAVDGSQKLPVRVIPTIVRARSQGLLPVALLRVIAAWIHHLRNMDSDVRDSAATTFISAAEGSIPEAVRNVLLHLAPALADDGEITQTVADLTAEFAGTDGRHVAAQQISI